MQATPSVVTAGSPAHVPLNPRQHQHEDRLTRSNITPAAAVFKPTPHEQRTLALTTYRSATVPAPDSVQESTWANVLERFKSPAIRSTKGGAAFSFLRLKPGTTRANDNVESHSAVVLDIDDGTPLEEITAQVCEYEFLAVSTHSHTIGHPKYRMILPLSRDVPPERWPQVWQLANQLIGGHADPATKDCARLYYFPSCPDELKGDAFFHHNSGRWLDPDELLTLRATPRNDITDVAAANFPFIAGIDLPPDENRICRDGQRTRHLASLIGHWISEALDLTAVIEKARTWNARNLPPLPDGKVVRTCESIWKTDARSHAALAPGVASALDAPVAAQRAALAFGAPATVEPLFDVESARARRFVYTKPKPREWLLKDCLPAGVVGSVVATGGTGKSYLMLQLAASIAAGIPFLDTWETGNPGEVLALMAEDDDVELHHRIHRLALHLDNTYPARNVQANIAQNVVVKSLLGENNLLTVLKANREVVQTDRVARIIATGQQMNNLKLIIVDPASRFRGGVENSAEDVTRFIEALERIRTAFPTVTLLVVHHTNKWSGQTDDITQAAARGSSAFSDGVRWQLNLTGLTSREAAMVPPHEKHLYLGLTITKNNYAPPHETVYVKRVDGAFVKENFSRTSKDDDGGLLLAVLRRIVSEGEKLSKNQFLKDLGGTKNVLSASDASIRACINHATDAGQISIPTEGKERPMRLTQAGRELIAAADSIIGGRQKMSDAR